MYVHIYQLFFILKFIHIDRVSVLSKRELRELQEDLLLD